MVVHSASAWVISSIEPDGSFDIPCSETQA